MQAYLFGLPLDEAVFHPEDAGSPLPLGPSGLLRMLEGMLGLSLPAENREHLRLGAFREALDHLLAGEPAVFFAASFKADPLGTAAELLARRDELLAAGWDFRQRPNTPERLAVLARTEPAYQRVLARLPKPAYGEADRLSRIRAVLKQRALPAFRLHLLEPPTCMPVRWQRLFEALRERGIAASQWEPPTPAGNTTDLHDLQQLLLDDQVPQKTPPRGDGSLLLVRADTDAQLAAFFAGWLSQNPGLQPRVLLPGPLAHADLALSQNGLPALGSAPASLARPSQQVLKLVPAFIWDPVDPYKMLEFVTLPHKPLNEKLALEIAELLAQSPGLHSQQWERRINHFFQEAGRRGDQQSRQDAASMRRQYRRWFERPRYPGQEAVPVDTAIPLFDELYLWAREQQAALEGRPSAFAALADQAQRLIELLQTQGSGLVSQRELEQMIRTVYDPTVLPMQIREAGALPVSFSAGATVRASDRLLWWHFVDRDRDPFFSRWYAEEREALQREGIALDSPASESSRALFYEKLPLLQGRQQLILGLPGLIDGQDTLPHPLLALLHARFSTLEPLTLHPGRETEPTPAAWTGFRLPGCERIAPSNPLQPPAFIRLRTPERLQANKPETYTSLEQLLYYPHQWLFQRKLRLLSSPLFRVADDATLLGSLAHRIFELLLAEEDILELDQPALEQRVEEIAENLLEREGAVLLMYGREPERVSFLRKIKRAAWTLVDLVKQNGWKIAGVELPLHGYFDGLEIRGRLDLLLQRGEEKAVVDLKWRGKTYRRQLMEQDRELQLVLYSRLATGNAQWAHTAYFIQHDAQLLARNTEAFAQAQAIRAETDHAAACGKIWQAMERTYRWRKSQLDQGLIEVRCTETLPRLEEAYGEELLEVLELPEATHKYDAYRTLIHLLD